MAFQNSVLVPHRAAKKQRLSLHPGWLAQRYNAFFLLLGLLLLPGPAIAAASQLQPLNLRCEYLVDPPGIDTVNPRLSWNSTARKETLRSQSQTAYQILVASAAGKLKSNQGDLWDTGKVTNSQSLHVKYEGQPLMTAQQCFWKLRIWDQDGNPSSWSETARWSMGLLGRSDWRGSWIGLDEKPSTNNPIAPANWIWYPEGEPEKSAPVGIRYFRRALDLPSRTVKKATLFFTSDNTGDFFINGEKVGTAADFHSASEFDVTKLLRPGQNLLASSVENVGNDPNPAGLIALLQVEFEGGEPLVVLTDSSWVSAREAEPNWRTATGGGGWTAAKLLGKAGMAPWGQVAGPQDRTLAARYLRREFSLEKRVERATAFVSGLGLSELYLNGKRVGDQALSPGLTDYTKRVYYVTHDVTELLKRGRNAVGVILGNGRFYGPRPEPGTVSYGYPKLLFQLRIEYTDGLTENVVSDSGWNLSTEGPIRANNEYDGEDYDATREFPGWTTAGFDDSKWQRAQMVQAPGGAPEAQMIHPIRVTETLKPKSVTESRPGVFIFDMGQNMVGWCRLKVSGPRGATVTLRHAEVLKPDGTLYLDNIRSAKVTDRYTLKGQGNEVYEPRFTYHGFRYVEVTGYPGKPGLNAIEGRVVNDDVPPAGEFSCSNPLLNRIYSNVRWGVRGNYRSMPTDCPQRDERQGWLGDRSAESLGETYLFDIAALYSKWLRDMEDAQKPTGSVPDVCPAYWPIYSDNVTWPSSTVIIPNSLRQQYGDDAIVETHYRSAKKWINYMSSFVTNGIISRDSYGDWCVPPEEQTLIHSKDPKRQTDRALLATAYFYYDLKLMERYASQLGKNAEARAFADQAARLKQAFNQRFLKPDGRQYDNGSQTSCVLPLAFGLVPEQNRGDIFAHLVEKITKETDNHIGTGLIGGQWLMRVLSDNGRADLAYAIATQKTYPSWGYMVEKGATTIWELWNGDTADPAMNSGNHVMLVGDLVIWLNEYVAGIRPDPEQPGFKHIIMRPEMPGDLRFAKATYRSPYGLIASEWRKENGALNWDIVVPVNTTATVYVPAPGGARVTESGKPAEQSPGIKFLKSENDRAVYLAGSGHYRFVVK